jgi:PAS domain S-box-containing protein
MESSPRLLLVCASTGLAQTVQDALRGQGFVLLVRDHDASDLEAEAILAAVVLVEMQAREQGAERVGALKSVTRSPILALCTEVESGEVSAAIAAGADDFMCVPLQPAELLSRIRARLRARSRSTSAVGEELSSEVLLELTRTLVSSLDFQEILYVLVSRVAEVVDVDRVSIVLVPDDGNVGYVVAASDDEKVTNLRLDLAKYPEIRHALKTRAALTISDVVHHPLLDEVRRSVEGAGLSALTLVPIVWEDHSMGVVFVRARTRRGALSPTQLRFCEVLANATAIALRNARVLQSLRDETQRDTYARIEAEKRLRVLKHYADLLASAADGLAAFDSDGRMLFANPAAHALVGYGPTEILGRLLWDIVPLDERKHALSLRRRLGHGEYPHNVDIRILHKDGRPMIINGSFAPLSGTEGAVLLSFRDVTEERRTRDELVHTRNFLQSLIDASVDAIVAADMRGTIVLFNKGAQQLYGYRSEDAIGKMNARQLYPGDGAREVMRMLRARSLGGPGRLEPVRIEAVDKNGTIFPISLTAAIIYEDGKATATFGIFTDLRERVRVEQQLAQAQEKLAISEKQALVAELAGATAHELNQPLTSVMGYAELLLRKLPNDSPIYRGAEVIHREAQRMAEIVRKIGKLTRYETKSYVGEQKILDLDRASGDDPDTAPDREP